MIPLHDDNPTKSTPVLTIALIIVNFLVFFQQLSLGLDRSVGMFGLVPSELIFNVNRPIGIREVEPGVIEAVRNLDPAWLTLFSSMFMHGSWIHIIGNMWFLWLFGNNVEDSMGKPKFLLFYFGAGLAAAAAQILMGPTVHIPMVGASGAIGGVLGAYLVLFPGSRVLTLITAFIITTVQLPAAVVLGLWFVIQIVSGLAGLLGPSAGGVAYAAHVGGFVFGMLLGRVLGVMHAHPPQDWGRREWGQRGRDNYTDWR